METPRSSTRPSRRSHPNLHHLSLAPLTTAPLDASSPPSPSENQAATPHTSYIQHKSAPSTPGILSLSQSRSNSRTRLRSRGPTSAYAYEGYFLNPDAGPVKDASDLPKAKSSSALLPSLDTSGRVYGRNHRRKGTAPGAVSLRSSGVKYQTEETGDEWLHRAGLAIAGETRECKGQSWLVRRASSTSLVHSPDDGYEDRSARESNPRFALLSGEHLVDEDGIPITPRLSRLGSRAGSRVASARNSRRGSRVGSRIELMMMSAGQKTPSARHSLEMEEAFEEDLLATEPDFVDESGEGVGDEEEVARLAREGGFGLGGWMDRFMGWTLFSVEEDGEESDEDEEENDAERPENMTREELKLRKEVEAKRRKMEREAIIESSAAKSKGSIPKGESSDGMETQSVPTSEDGGGWQDAAWLLSVASKVLF